MWKIGKSTARLLNQKPPGVFSHLCVVYPTSGGTLGIISYLTTSMFDGGRQQCFILPGNGGALS